MLSPKVCRLGGVSRCTNYLDRIVGALFSARSMRIEVVNKFTDRRVLDDLDSSDTISTLKARIMDEFGLTHKAMKQRLLIADERGMMNINQPRILRNARDLLRNARDLLEVVEDDSSSTTLESCSIGENSILHLGWKVPFIILIVDTYERKEYPIKCKYNETFSVLVRKIKKVTKLKVLTAMNLPTLLHICNYNVTINPLLFSLGYYSMQPDADDAPQHRIYMNRVNGMLYGAEDFNEDFNTFFQREHPRRNPYTQYSRKLQIFVELLNFPIKLLSLVLSPSHTFGEITMYINRLVSNKFELRVPLDMRRFATCFEGKQIGADITIDEVGIKHMDSIQLFSRDPFRIDIVHISHLGNVEGSYTVRLRCFDTVGKLKEKIQDMTGVPKKGQRLKYDGWCLDDEKRSLEYYGIGIYWRWWEERNGCLPCKEPEADFKIHLHQEPTFNSESETWKSSANEVLLHSLREHKKLDPFFFLPSSSPRGKSLQIGVEVPHMQRKIPLDVNPGDSIGSVIRAIVDQVNVMGHARITGGAVVLAFGTKVIQDESITLDDCGIKHTDSVQLLEKAPILFKVIAVGHKQRETLFVEMRCFDTIGSLKEMLEVATRIPKEEQKVAYVQKPLNVNIYLDDEKRRLVDYDIHLVDKEWIRCGKNPKIRVATTKKAIGYLCKLPLGMHSSRPWKFYK